MFEFDAKYLAGRPKEILRDVFENYKNSTVKYSIKKSILVNFVNVSIKYFAHNCILKF